MKPHLTDKARMEQSAAFRAGVLWAVKTMRDATSQWRMNEAANNYLDTLEADFRAMGKRGNGEVRA